MLHGKDWLERLHQDYEISAFAPQGSGHSPGTGVLFFFSALIPVAATLVVSKSFFILMNFLVQTRPIL